ncbi:hypothetical protein GCM10028807_18640 [Spirosoma daeguense]
MTFRWFLFLSFITLTASAQKLIPPLMLPDPDEALQTYRASLAQIRQEHTNQHELPNLKFFTFGMGNRLKLIYRNGRLLNALTGNIEEQWRVKHEVIVPSEYAVHLELADGQIIQIREDETGVWLLQPDKKPKLIPGTRSRVELPRFDDKPFGPVLRVLHQEILINVANGRPMPNFLVYYKPHYRDAAMMTMVLRETNNLPLIRDWIMAIRDPFDRANRGVAEADNLGQVLFLVAQVSDKSHPAVAMVLDSVKRFQKENYIIGKTNQGEHPVFQTKWLKYGLKLLDIDESYAIPKQYDSYSSLFWWGYKDEYVTGKPIESALMTNHPYLAWAEDHFFGQKRAPFSNLDYPLSWEQQATNAHYPGMTVLEPALVKKKIAPLHAWQAAEMFLLLKTK